MILLLFCGCLLLGGCMMPDKAKQAAENALKLKAEGIEPLLPGEPAPAFSAPLADGTSFSFSPGQGSETLLLFFFPAIDTPNSTANLLSLQELETKLIEKGHSVRAYGITAASAAELSDFAARYKISLPLIPDPGLPIAINYGCAKPGDSLPQRTLVAIGPDGNILWYGRGFHPQELEKLLSSEAKEEAAEAAKPAAGS